MVTYYLDLATGEVLSVDDEERDLLERFYESYYDEQSQTVDWETGFREMQVQDWQRDRMREADRVEKGFGEHIVEIPKESSHEGYLDMAAFIGSVRNPHLQQLERAISGRGAFRYFKDVLWKYPAERERWFQFQQERLNQRILDWLEEQEITPVCM